MDKAKRMVIVPERITLDRLTLFEYAEIVSNRIRDVGNGGTLYIDQQDLVVSVDEYDKKLSKEGKEIVLENNQFHIIEDSTYALVKMEINKGKTPYLIVRVIKETDDTVLAELVNPNNCMRPI